MQTPAAPQPSASPVVDLDGVTVIYGANRALKNVTASFAHGAVGLLGPNGAGKSTMLKALLGFVAPNEGRMSVLGMNVAEQPLEIRARIGYMPESDAHIPGMNAVSFVALLRPARRPAAPSTRCSARTRCSTTSVWARRATATSRRIRPG